MSEKKEAQSLAYWSGRAPEFSRLHMDSYVSDKRMMFAEQVAMSIPARDNLNALDIGCGSGFMTMLLLDAGCRVTGIDFSEDMLACARENLAGKGYEATLLRMRAQKLEFPDGSFDFVVSRNVTWTLEDVDSVYAEIMRVLADGGVYLNLDANYGRKFNEADARGEVPTHPTQTLEQLRQRNAIARDLAITQVDRPEWDVGQFWRLGASAVNCRQVGEGTNVPASRLFALEVHKGKGAWAAQPHPISSLDTPSQPSLAGSDAPEANVVESRQRAKVMLVDYVRMGAFEFDPRKFVVRKDGVPVKLTPKEFNVLLTLARNAGQTVSQADLRAAVWGNEFTEEAINLAVYIRRIRAKIEDDPARPRYLLTRWGEGYTFNPHGAGQ
ncbi:MAG: methyltransferase domain-containing protein [Eggerthellaceae bacterium]|nr:methyltransferase domain-containing protein [Eggerthellaceae bacterium]